MPVREPLHLSTALPSPCDNIVFSMTQGIKNPSMTGEATQMYLAGSQAYGDGLWNNHLIGDVFFAGYARSESHPGSHPARLYL